MFEFPALLDSLEAAPEHFRSLYSPQDGKFHLHEDFKKHVGGLTSALDKERRKATDLGKTVTAWAALGETPEAVTTKITELTESVAKAGNVNLDKIKTDIAASYTTKLGEKDATISKMNVTLNKYLVENAAITAITDAKGSPELLLPIIQKQVSVVQNGEEYVVRVLDADGDVRGDGKGGFMGVKELVAELKSSTAYGRAFEASGIQGGGAKPGSGGRPAPKPGTELTPLQKITLGIQKGQLAGRK